MARPGPRLHRLPQRLDYTLIPAPLDLSLPTLSEKSPLPAIIVTPSSPSDDHRFSIAFLAPPPKPTLRERFSSYSPSFPLTARTAIILTIMIFIMICHLVAHKMAVDLRRPHLDFSVSVPVQEQQDLGSWFGIGGRVGVERSIPDFVVDEAVPVVVVEEAKI
ncbi:hypothetical protein VNI00_000882 [Paramarasmius palmivorus]|uniref:Uncharacterized protein n=1 Tax=Paramarasmius palmivorus TaxID=297713 RepID=A0AAW0EAE2_9AGAR